MPNIVTLAEVKEHLRITNTTEDNVIQIYMDATDEWIGNYLNQDTVPVRPSIKAAALLLIGDLYENRESAGEGTIKENPSARALLYPFRVEIGI